MNEEWTELDALHDGDSDSTEIYNDQAQSAAEADFRKSETAEVVEEDLVKKARRRAMRFSATQEDDEFSGEDDERWGKFKL